MVKEPDAISLHAAAELAALLEDIAGRPLTQEERARCHQHTAMVDAMFRVHVGQGGRGMSAMQPSEATMSVRDAITILRSAGYDISVAAEGDVCVNGEWLTTGEILDLASEVYNG